MRCPLNDEPCPCYEPCILPKENDTMKVKVGDVVKIDNRGPFLVCSTSKEHHLFNFRDFKTLGEAQKDAEREVAYSGNKQLLFNCIGRAQVRHIEIETFWTL